MPDYNKGKIYKITGTNSDGNLLTYIGSTIHEYLSQRLSKHRGNYKEYKTKGGKCITSFQILDLDDCIITLIQLCPCNCREELLMNERKYYDLFDCVNIRKPYITDSEFKEYHKQYYIDNAEKISEKGKQYRMENADIIKKRKKTYSMKNPDKIIQYRIDNAAKIKEQRKAYRLRKKLEKEINANI